MVHYQDTYMPGNPRARDWSTEITPPGQRRAPVMVGTEAGRNTTGMTSPAVVTPPELSDMQNDLPVEVIQAPTSVGEAYLGSWKALLSRYEGSYVVATFLEVLEKYAFTSRLWVIRRSASPSCLASRMTVA